MTLEYMCTTVWPKRKYVIDNDRDLATPKVPFVIPNRNHRVTWYTCGPTVYDNAHLGHARNYVTVDILTSVVEKFFKYPVSMY
jgi:cysteinyl-tRNA synthetase